MTIHRFFFYSIFFTFFNQFSCERKKNTIDLNNEIFDRNKNMLRPQELLYMESDEIYTTLERWKASLSIKWHEPLHYFSTWTLMAFFFIPEEIILLQQMKWNMLFITSMVGFYMTYVYPKKIFIHYLNLCADGLILQVIDIFAHQIPFLYSLFYENTPQTTFWLEHFFVNIPIFVYIFSFDYFHLYHVRESDVLILLGLYYLSFRFR